ncbi:hypothetical protein D3C80_1658950 [compost metagenome]
MAATSAETAQKLVTGGKYIPASKLPERISKNVSAVIAIKRKVRSAIASAITASTGREQSEPTRKDISQSGSKSR